MRYLIDANIFVYLITDAPDTVKAKTANAFIDTTGFYDK